MIRVLRVLEYEYANAETMTRDMPGWTVGANATKKFSENITVRSSVMLPEEED